MCIQGAKYSESKTKDDDAKQLVTDLKQLHFVNMISLYQLVSISQSIAY